MIMNMNHKSGHINKIMINIFNSLQDDVSKHFQAVIKAVFIYITIPSMSI